MPDPIWISHRGYCKTATENTAEAFRAALALGFDHLETDLRCTADGHLVLSHDDDLSRVTFTPLSIKASTRAQLEKMTLKGGEHLLFFDDFLEEFANCHWILDIKPEQGAQVLECLLAWWEKPGYKPFFDQRVRFLFWEPEQQRTLLHSKPEAQCMATIRECQRAGTCCLVGLTGLANIRPDVTYAVPPKWHGIPLLCPPVVNRYRAQGGRVLAYLPEDQAQAQTAVDLGVDEILTNHAPLGASLHSKETTPATR